MKSAGRADDADPLPVDSVNHSRPSGPAVISPGSLRCLTTTELAVGAAGSAAMGDPATWSGRTRVNQIPPSGPRHDAVRAYRRTKETRADREVGVHTTDLVAAPISVNHSCRQGPTRSPPAPVSGGSLPDRGGAGVSPPNSANRLQGESADPVGVRVLLGEPQSTRARGDACRSAVRGRNGELVDRHGARRKRQQGENADRGSQQQTDKRPPHDAHHACGANAIRTPTCHALPSL